MIQPSKNRLDFLDALRGVAALSVCIQHIFGSILKSSDKTNPFYIFVENTTVTSMDVGRFGVVLFFLISGFIIPYTLKPTATLHSFAIGRVFRLYPAYWLALLLTFVLAPYLSHVDYTWGQLAANITMVPKLFQFEEMSGVFWTLFIEILFYVLCAILFSIKQHEKPIVIGLIALLFNISSPIAILLNKFFQLGLPVQFILFHLSFLFIGSLFRLAIDKQNKMAKQLSVVVLVTLLFSIPITTGLFFSVNEVVRGFVMFQPFATAVAYFLAITIFIFGVKFRLPKNKFFIDIGIISYSLYLLHMLCFTLAQKIMQPATIITTFSFIILSTFLAYIAAKLSYQYIEHPTIELGKKVNKTFDVTR